MRNVNKIGLSNSAFDRRPRRLPDKTFMAGGAPVNWSFGCNANKVLSMKENIKTIFILVIYLSLVVRIAVGQEDLQATVHSAVVLQAMGPKYPPIALAAKASGEVVIEVKINKQGLVTDTNIVSGHKLLREATTQAAKRWIFSPVTSGKEDRKERLIFRYVILADDASYADEGSIYKVPYEYEIRNRPLIAMVNSDPKMKTTMKR